MGKQQIQSVWENLDTTVKAAILELKYQCPTEIQNLVFKPIGRGASILAIAQTGTGKTFAYSLPLALKIKKSESPDARTLKRMVTAAPKAIIFCPTRELAYQVHQTIKVLCHTIKLSSGLAVAGKKINESRYQVQKPMDILVTTTGRLLGLIKFKLITLRDVQTIVIDETDTMYEMGFFDELQQLLKHVKNKKGLQGLSFGAVSTPKIAQHVKQLFPDTRTIETKDAYKFVQSVRQVFIPVKPGKKEKELINTLSKQKRGHKTLIFCNSVVRCKTLAQSLEEQDYKILLIYGKLSTEERQQTIKKFISHASFNLLVCTDIASRGLDIEHCDHVINYDMPKSESLFLHRAGRTARAEKQGTVSTFITDRDVILATAINQSFELGLQVPRARKVITERNKDRQKAYEKKQEVSKSHKRNKKTGITIRSLDKKKGSR